MRNASSQRLPSLSGDSNQATVLLVVQCYTLRQSSARSSRVAVELRCGGCGRSEPSSLPRIQHGPTSSRSPYPPSCCAQCSTSFENRSILRLETPLMSIELVDLKVSTSRLEHASRTRSSLSIRTALFRRSCGWSCRTLRASHPSPIRSSRRPPNDHPST